MVSCAPRFHVKVLLEGCQAINDISDEGKILEMVKKLNEKYLAQSEQKLISFNNQGEILVSLFQTYLSKDTASLDVILENIPIINNQMKYHQRSKVVQSYQKFIANKDLDSLNQEEMMKVLKINYLLSLNQFCLELHEKLQESFG